MQPFALTPPDLMRRAFPPCQDCFAPSLQAPATKETQSSRREFQPRLTLIAPIASSGSTPIALNTCDRCTFPDEQAEPDDTAKPSISKAISNTCASMEGRRSRTYSATLSRRRRRTPRRARHARSPPPSRPARETAPWFAPLAGPSRQQDLRPFRQLRQYFRFPRATRALGRRRAGARLLCGKSRSQNTVPRRPSARQIYAPKRRSHRHPSSKITRDLSRRLNRVADQKPPSRMDDVRGRRNRLHHAGLVVGGLKGQHNAMPGGARASDRLAKGLEIEHARRRQTDKFKLRGRETVSRKDRRMFSGARQEQVERP